MVFEPAPKRRPWLIPALAVAAAALVATTAVAATVALQDDPAPAQAQPAATTPPPLAQLGAPCPTHGLMGDGINGGRYRCEGGKWIAADTGGQFADLPDVPAIPPEPGDFTLTARVTSKHCFGSAGCNVKFKIEAGWVASFDPANTWEVTYEVRGPEDGPLIDTLEVTGDEYTVGEHLVSTPRRSTKLTVRATHVAEVG